MKGRQCHRAPGRRPDGRGRQEGRKGPVSTFFPVVEASQALRPRPLPSSPGHRVDRHGHQQHDAGHHVGSSSTQADEVYAVVHGRDHDAAEHGMKRLTTAAIEAGATDDRRRYGIKHVGGVDVGSDRADLREVHEPGDTGHEPR